MDDLQYLEEPINDQYPDIEAQNLHMHYDEPVREHETGIHIRNALCDLIALQ